MGWKRVALIWMALAGCIVATGCSTSSAKAGATASTSWVPRVTGKAASTHDVHVSQLDPSTAAELVAAFSHYENIPSTCRSSIVAGDAWVGKDLRSGASYAVAAFAPDPGCNMQLKDIYGNIAPPSSSRPWSFHAQPIAAVFEKAGGSWTMNMETGKPFPCPARGASGLGNANVPADVLHAWKMPYASRHCVTPTILAP